MPSKSVPNSRSIESDDDSATPAEEIERLNGLLSRLNIRFLNCTFTYKDAHFDPSCHSTEAFVEKRKSLFKKFTSTVRNTLERISDSIGCEDIEFKNCVFVPTAEEDRVKHFVKKRFGDIKIIFENCKFIKRGSTFYEKVAKKFRNVFGIIFELAYIDSNVLVKEYSFRLKDLGIVTTYLQERILKKG